MSETCQQPCAEAVPGTIAPASSSFPHDAMGCAELSEAGSAHDYLRGRGKSRRLSDTLASAVSAPADGWVAQNCLKRALYMIIFAAAAKAEGSPTRLLLPFLHSPMDGLLRKLAGFFHE